MDVTVYNPKGSDQIYKSHCRLSFRVQKVEYSVELRTEGNCEIDYCRYDESSGQKFPAAAAVSYEAVHKTGESIDDTIKGDECTELKLGDSQFLLHCRKCGTEILSEEVIKNVGNHQDDKGPPLPIVVLFSNLLIH